MDAKSRVTASIAQAQAELERALSEMDRIPTFSPALIGLVAHSLSNYITVTSAAVEMLQLSLRDYKDADVSVWLEGIGHTADLMQHSVSRLVTMAPARDFPLKLEQVNLRVLMERACEYYRRRADTRQLYITCGAVGPVPLAWGDRVALAVVADNLLSNAVRASKPHGAIAVQILAEPGHVVCCVNDAGAGLTAEEKERLFAPVARTEPPGPDQPIDYGVTIASEYVHLMDGDLWCESEPGRGSSFSFRLPAVE